MQDACGMACIILRESYHIVLIYRRRGEVGPMATTPQVGLSFLFVPATGVADGMRVPLLSLAGLADPPFSVCTSLAVDAEPMPGVFVEGFRKVYVLALYPLSPESACFMAPNFSPKMRSMVSSPPMLFKNTIAACRLLCQLTASTVEFSFVTSNPYGLVH